MWGLFKIIFFLQLAQSEAPSPLSGALAPPAAAPAAASKKQAGVSEDSPESGEKKSLDKAQIRKLLSNQNDPSMLLEPPPEKEKKEPEKPKPPPPPGPPSPPVAGISSMMSTKSTIKLTPNIKGNNDAPTSPEIAVILVDRQFIPQRIRMKDGMQTKLFFTTINDRPAALIVEKLQIQRWVGKETGAPKGNSELERARFEVTREINRSRITEILLSPQRGNYSFHDAISGARGQIIVE